MHKPKTGGIQVDVMTPHGAVLSCRAASVTARGTEGEMEIRPGHAPLLTHLQPGAITIHPHDDEVSMTYYVDAGSMEVQPQQVTILASSTTPAEAIDEAALEQERLQLLAQLKNKTTNYQQALEALSANSTQIRIAQALKKQQRR